MASETPAGRVVLFILLVSFVGPLIIYGVQFMASTAKAAIQSIPSNDTVSGGVVGGLGKLLVGLYTLLSDPYVVAVLLGAGLILGVLQARGS